MGLFEFSIDIENATTGAKFGSGPITSATNWTHTPRLDGAGEFSFTMPASDEKSRSLANKRIARCYAILNGARTELGAGIIDTIQTQVGSPTMLEVSGPDIMGELATRTVGNLIICEQGWVDLSDATKGMLGWFRTGVTWTTAGTAAASGSYVTDENIAIPLAHDGSDVTYESIYLASDKTYFPEACTYLYVGHDARFDRIRVLFAGADFANNNHLLYAQYYNGMGWETLTIATDGTAVGGYTFKQDGDITFTRPTDWTRYTAAYGGGDWFWVRLRVARTWPDDPSWTDYFKLAEVDVYADIPTRHGVNLIMSKAPATWTGSGWVLTDADVYPLTASDKYLEFNGESVLEALLTLAEQGGVSGTTAVREHFRYDTITARKVDWIGTTVTSSGVRAVAPEYALLSEGKAELAIIQSLTVQQDTAETVTRIYPRTADSITLALTSKAAMTGYTQDLTANYIQHTAGFASYGQIDRWMEFSELSLQQSDSYTTHPEYLADQLHDRATEWLRTHATVNYFYNLSIVQFLELIRPGDSIHCVYHEYTDTYHTVDIDTVADATPLRVIAPTIQANSQGVGVIGLEVATIDREAKTDAGVVVDLVRQNRKTAGASNTYTLTSESIVATLPADQRVYTYAETFGNVTATAYTVTHNLNVADVLVQVYETTTGTKQKQDPDIYQTGVNTVRIVTQTAPGTNTLRVRVIGFNRGGDEGGGGVVSTAYYVYVGDGGDPPKLYKYNQNGAVIWASPLYAVYTAGLYQLICVNGVAVNSAGNAFIAGKWQNATGTYANVAAYDAGGSQKWNVALNANAGNTEPSAIAATPNGNAFVNAEILGGVAVYYVNGTTGAVVWSAAKGGVGQVAVDESGNCYASGVEITNKAIWAWSPSGTSLWDLDVGGNSPELALNGVGHLYANKYTNTTTYIAKYNVSDGSEVTTGGFPIVVA
jgi:hypothetical protein